jgi:hypothetical protein
MEPGRVSIRLRIFHRTLDAAQTRCHNNFLLKRMGLVMMFASGLGIAQGAAPVTVEDGLVQGMSEDTGR